MDDRRTAQTGLHRGDLNLGCPAGTVTAKGKGSGMLRDLAKLDAFLAAVFANAEGPISVKTRLGVDKPEEFAAILVIYNQYPICGADHPPARDASAVPRTRPTVRPFLPPCPVAGCWCATTAT